MNVCKPVHVGTIACDNAGAASLRIAVVAEPFTAVSPIVAVGSAKPLNEPGRSADVNARNDGAPLPDVGPAKTKFWEVVAAPVPPLAIGRMLVPTAADFDRSMLPKPGAPRLKGYAGSDLPCLRSLQRSPTFHYQATRRWMSASLLQYRHWQRSTFLPASQLRLLPCLG